MGGEGTMAAANTSLKNNRYLLQQKRNPFNNDKLDQFGPGYHKALRFKRVSAVKLEKIKRKIREVKRKEKIRLISALIVSVLLITAFIAVFWKIHV